MTDEEWYRNQNWDPHIKQKFLDKLAKSRSQRDQYLVIQASIISDNFPEATLELIDFYFATRKDDFHDVLAYWAKASAYDALESETDMILAYKAVLDREKEFPKHSTMAFVEFPYLIASRNISSEYDFALSLLTERYDDCLFKKDFYMWHAVQALIANEQQRFNDASKQAEKAIEFAAAKKSGFRYHQKVGLVGDEHDAILKRLFEIIS